MLTMKVYFRDHTDQDVYRTEIFEVDRLFLKEYQTSESQVRAQSEFGLSYPVKGVITTVHQVADQVDTVDHYLHEGYRVFVENASGKTTMAIRY